MCVYVCIYIYMCVCVCVCTCTCMCVGGEEVHVCVNVLSESDMFGVVITGQSSLVYCGIIH